LFIKKQVINGGPARLAYIVPSFTFECLRLITRIFEREQREDSEQTVNTRTVFKLIHALVSTISTTSPQLSVRLFLAAALSADKCAFEEIGYEFMTQAFVTYEEEIANSKEQYAAILLFAGTVQVVARTSRSRLRAYICVQQLCSVGEEGYKTLSTKVSQHAARLLRKTDQVLIYGFSLVSTNIYSPGSCTMRLCAYVFHFKECWTK
jgi:vacuolar protein sorting-associated protein 35